jgi:hypothetical protein
MNLPSSPRDPEPFRRNARFAQPRPALAAILLVAAICLSCSTACLTMAVVDEAKDALTPTPGETAQRQLRQNLRAHGGAEALVFTGAPDSLRQALVAALPDPGHSSVAEPGVAIETTSDPATGAQGYRITAWGNFDFYYANAFANYADQLRRQRAKPPAIHLVIERQDSGGRRKLMEYDFK